jgi:hypothetical protein
MSPVAPPSPTADTVSATIAPAPRPEGATTSATLTGGLIGALLSAAVVAALIAAAVNIMLARRKSREEERARLREHFVSAFSAYSDYCEFAYAVPRRRHDNEQGERVRISEEMRKVQAEIRSHEVWVQIESPDVGAAYTELVQLMRQVAGGAIRQGWDTPAPTTDAEMNVPPTKVDLSPLKPYEQAYMDAVARHLKALTPWWAK